MAEKSNASDSRRPGRPRISVEDRLMGAVERLLGTGRSFSSLTVEDLAAEARIARATFYLRFKEKTALIAWLMERISDDIVAGSGRWFNPDTESDPATIQEAMRGIARAFKRHQSVLAAVAEVAPFDPTVAALHCRMLEQLRAQSRQAIARIRLQGRAHAMATDALADLLTDLFELYLSRHLRSLDAAALERLADLMAHVGNSAIFSMDVLQDARGAGKKTVKVPGRRAGAGRKARSHPG